MIAILALDTSKRNTGWAVWQTGWDEPKFGSKQMGSEYTSSGKTCLALHSLMNDLRMEVCRFEVVYVEQPLTQMERGGASNPGNDIQLKLVGHAESYASARSCRCHLINVKSWARHFIGSMPRGTKSKDKKGYTIERCRQYGWRPMNSDEGDALGLLDYALDCEGVIPPWRANETLRQPLTVGGAA